MQLHKCGQNERPNQNHTPDNGSFQVWQAPRKQVSRRLRHADPRTGSPNAVTILPYGRAANVNGSKSDDLIDIGIHSGSPTRAFRPDNTNISARHFVSSLEGVRERIVPTNQDEPVIVDDLRTPDTVALDVAGPQHTPGTRAK